MFPDGKFLYKKSPVEGRGNLMFSQRNNPYCELLSFYVANLYKKNLATKFFLVFLEKFFSQ